MKVDLDRSYISPQNYMLSYPDMWFLSLNSKNKI